MLDGQKDCVRKANFDHLINNRISYLLSSCCIEARTNLECYICVRRCCKELDLQDIVLSSVDRELYLVIADIFAARLLKNICVDFVNLAYSLCNICSGSAFKPGRTSEILLTCRFCPRSIQTILDTFAPSLIAGAAASITLIWRSKVIVPSIDAVEAASGKIFHFKVYC